MIGSGQAPPSCSTTLKNSALLRWFAVLRQKAKPDGRFV
jgi:hypothetical protein